MSVFILLLILFTTTKVQSQYGAIQFHSEVFLESGDACIVTRNGVKVNGMCMGIQNCPTILASVVDRNVFDHTVCGYEGKTQIICCPFINGPTSNGPTSNGPTSNAPTSNGLQIRQTEKLNLKENLECVVANTNEKGVIKFLSDCPQISRQDAGAHVNILCTDEICSDLVCCPGRVLGRSKNVCQNVDHPLETLELRLFRNQECTVKGLNIKGRYQDSCAFAERNPDLKPMLQSVCDDDICSRWYCCPIEDGDKFECTAKRIRETTGKLVGPKCTDSKSGRVGTCKRTFDCAHPEVLSLDNCGSYCCDDYYCCPDDLGAVNEPISVRECNTFNKYLSKAEIEVPMNLYVNRSSCFPPTFAAGGIIADPGEFPHMAALGYKPMQEVLWQCGGSLISNRYVLTAGHCLTDRKLGPVQRVRLGVVDLLNDVKTADCPEDFDVANIIPHPEYDPKFVYNDIGLIELATQVIFNFHIRPICLPPNAVDEQFYESMGWGATGTAEESSVKLIKVNQELFTYEECQKQYDVSRRYPTGIMQNTHICAGSRDSIQSTCPGDSGGPLVVHQKANYKLFYIYGIVSFGSPCGFANSPGIYTRVFPYLKWIEETVWKN